MQTNEILETIKMIDEEYLDIRTITMGISLLDCMDPDIQVSCQKVEEKIKQYTQGMLYNAKSSGKFNGFGGDSNFTYVWTGNTTDFTGLGDLSNDPNTVFIIRNNK